jgi:hypothetical protein
MIMIITLIFCSGGFEVSLERTFLGHRKIPNPKSDITSKCALPCVSTENMGRDIKLVMHHVHFIPQLLRFFGISSSIMLLLRTRKHNPNSPSTRQNFSQYTSLFTISPCSSSRTFSPSCCQYDFSHPSEFQ